MDYGTARPHMIKYVGDLKAVQTGWIEEGERMKS